MQEIRRGFFTGMMLQLAIGPVFFYIVNLALQKTFLDGLAGTLAVTLVDYLYITFAILGVGRLLEHARFKLVLGRVGPVVLVLFGVSILWGVLNGGSAPLQGVGASNIFASFTSVFMLTISSPLTIVFFTSLFTARALEYGYTKKQLALFGAGTGFATFTFMGTAIVLFSMVREKVPFILILGLNAGVGLLLIFYGLSRLYQAVRVPPG